MSQPEAAMSSEFSDDDEVLAQALAGVEQHIAQLRAAAHGAVALLSGNPPVSRADAIAWDQRLVEQEAVDQAFAAQREVDEHAEECRATGQDWYDRRTAGLYLRPAVGGRFPWRWKTPRERA